MSDRPAPAARPSADQPPAAQSDQSAPPVALGGARPGSGELRAAAFGASPGAEVSGWAAPNATRRSSGDAEDWSAFAAAVVLGGQGRYAAAGVLLDRLRRHPDRRLAAHAGIALASHRRQLGGHALARALDGAALRTLLDGAQPSRASLRPVAELIPDCAADDLDLAGARADALLGLAADALGLGRVTEAHRLRTRAVTEAAETGRSGVAGERSAVTAGWRTEIRAAWIGAEIALGSQDPERAVDYAASAVELAQEAGAVRHAIKSELIRSAGLATLAPAQAIPRLRSVVEQATAFRQLPLLWPAGLLLARLDPSRDAQWTDISRKALVEVLVGAGPEIFRCARSSPWVPWSLLRSGDVDSRGTRSKIFTD